MWLFYFLYYMVRIDLLVHGVATIKILSYQFINNNNLIIN